VGTPLALKFEAKVRSKGSKRTRKHLLSREFRAELYYTHSFFQLHEKGIQCLSKFPHAKRRAEKLKNETDPKVIAEYEKGIGPKWTYVLRHAPHTYSGLNVKELSEVLGRPFLQWYETMYHFQSRAVHANDPLKFADITDSKSVTAMFISSDAHVYESLRVALTLLLVHIRLLHEHIGFGTDVDTAYASLKLKYDRLSWTEQVRRNAKKTKS
jgi:hypothetical protein